MVREEIMNLPPASHLHETELGWENFESTVFFPTIHDFISKIKKAFSNIWFWIQLSIFDPGKLPLTKDELTSYGTHEFSCYVLQQGKAQKEKESPRESSEEFVNEIKKRTLKLNFTEIVNEWKWKRQTVCHMSKN